MWVSTCCSRALASGSELGHDVADDLAEVDRLAAQHHPAGLDPRHVEHVVDQPLEAVRVAPHRAHRPLEQLRQLAEPALAENRSR